MSSSSSCFRRRMLSSSCLSSGLRSSGTEDTTHTLNISLEPHIHTYSWEYFYCLHCVSTATRFIHHSQQTKRKWTLFVFYTIISDPYFWQIIQYWAHYNLVWFPQAAFYWRKLTLPKIAAVSVLLLTYQTEAHQYFNVQWRRELSQLPCLCEHILKTFLFNLVIWPRMSWFELSLHRWVRTPFFYFLQDGTLQGPWCCLS